jgi:hypothetical protein
MGFWIYGESDSSAPPQAAWRRLNGFPGFKGCTPESGWGSLRWEDGGREKRPAKVFFQIGKKHEITSKKKLPRQGERQKKALRRSGDKSIYQSNFSESTKKSSPDPPSRHHLLRYPHPSSLRHSQWHHPRGSTRSRGDETMRDRALARRQFGRSLAGVVVAFTFSPAMTFSADSRSAA